MLRKVREMGREFQDGVKKMADEVELDAVTRKLNEAGNISIDDVGKKKKSDADGVTPVSNYEEFDYDAYDYENGGHSSPSKPDIKPDDDATNEISQADDTTSAASDTVKVEDAPAEVTISDDPHEKSANKDKESKSKEK